MMAWHRSYSAIFLGIPRPRPTTRHWWLHSHSDYSIAYFSSASCTAFKFIRSASVENKPGRIYPYGQKRPKPIASYLEHGWNVVPQRKCISGISNAVLGLHPAILAPMVFSGLVCTLWAYKCLMMILFQNQIIYMPGVPIGARGEKIQDYSTDVLWREMKIPTDDSTVVLACAVADIVVPIATLSDHSGEQVVDFRKSRPVSFPGFNCKKRQVVVVYFQGNASSTPSRLPFLSQIMKSLSKQVPERDIGRGEITYTFIIPSYRGYWTSTGRPSQRGIEKDGKAIFRFLQQQQWQQSNPLPLETGDNNPDYLLSIKQEEIKYILWGQSIGANIALTSLANHLSEPDPNTPSHHQQKIIPSAIILETPFLSIKDMLIELYPQKWLPYRYLAPFLWNHWDLPLAVRRLSESGVLFRSGGVREVLVVRAESDELVSEGQGKEVVRVFERFCNGSAGEGGGEQGRENERKGEGKVKDVVVGGALHVDCMFKPRGRSEVVNLIRG